jgi:hypothetical protein
MGLGVEEQDGVERSRRERSSLYIFRVYFHGQGQCFLGIKPEDHISTLQTSSRNTFSHTTHLLAPTCSPSPT